jgi:putative N-acetyltransferase (TIGR04045 family)
MSTSFSPAPVTSARAVCRLAAGRAELDAHFAVRRAIFVEAQALFPGDDRDARDARDSTLHAVAEIADEILGTVRLYPLDARGLWKGDRLAVLPSARVHRLGGMLVDFAVRAAGARGGERMVAQVQVPNVRFFEHLGWVADGRPAPYRGVMHQPMAIPLRAPAR